MDFKAPAGIDDLVGSPELRDQFAALWNDDSRDGFFDNDRVTVWEYIGPITSSRHTHLHDAVVVAIDSPSPRAVWIAQGTVHADEGAGRASRVYLFEIK